jgi:hypothetical protein
MSSITFDVKVKADTKAWIASIQQQLKDLPNETYRHFVDITPIRSGNARSRTMKSGNTIRADYVYASRLDTGYSKQAPDGMTKPTEKFMQQRIKQIIGK